MKLRCIHSYRARSVVYNPGDELEVSAAEATYLLADAPGCFEEVPKEQPGATTDRGTGAPPSHKKIEPQRRKRR